MIHVAATIVATIVVGYFLMLLSPILLLLIPAAALYFYIDYMMGPGIAPLWVWWINIGLVCAGLYVAYELVTAGIKKFSAKR